MLSLDLNLVEFGWFYYTRCIRSGYGYDRLIWDTKMLSLSQIGNIEKIKFEIGDVL